MKTDPSEFLKVHIKELHECIEKSCGENLNLKRIIALQLFDIWRQDLEGARLIRNSEGLFVSPRGLTLEELAARCKNTKDNVKPAVTRVRSELSSPELHIGGQVLRFSISKHHYSFCASVEPDPLATRRLVWEPYLDGGTVVVACVKRLFFQVRKDVYIRNITVDNPGSYDKCPTLKSLIGKGPAQSVRMYAPSGEVSGSYALLDMFNNQLNVKAVGTLISPSYSHAGKNLIVLGSGIEEPHYEPPPALGFSFRNVQNGVEDTRKKDSRYLDRSTDERAKVHVLVQRWQKSDGNIITVVYSSHAVAVEIVINHLASETLASELNIEFRRLERRLRNQVDFECLLEVQLDRNGLYFEERTISILRLGDRFKVHPRSSTQQDRMKMATSA